MTEEAASAGFLFKIRSWNEPCRGNDGAAAAEEDCGTKVAAVVDGEVEAPKTRFWNEPARGNDGLAGSTVIGAFVKGCSVPAGFFPNTRSASETPAAAGACSALDATVAGEVDFSTAAGAGTGAATERAEAAAAAPPALAFSKSARRSLTLAMEAKEARG